MKRTIMLAAGSIAGFLLLAPGVALATSPTGTSSPTSSASPSPSPSSSPSPTEDVDGPGPHGTLYGLKKPLSVSPAKGRAGDRIKLDFDCRYREDDNGGPAISSAALTADVTKKTAVVKNVKPGKYTVTLSCWIDKSTVTFEVLPEKGQVTKVPAGAPQTGGAEGPADHAGVLAAVAGGVALVAGGVGAAAYRRRAARD